MEDNKTFLTVAAIIVDKLGVNETEVTPEAAPKYDLGADSLDIVELFMEYEREFQIKIHDEYTTELKTVKDSVIYINNYLDGREQENKKFFLKKSN